MLPTEKNDFIAWWQTLLEFMVAVSSYPFNVCGPEILQISSTALFSC